MQVQIVNYVENDIVQTSMKQWLRRILTDDRYTQERPLKCTVISYVSTRCTNILCMRYRKDTVVGNSLTIL